MRREGGDSVITVAFENVCKIFGLICSITTTFDDSLVGLLF
jgi:hypothetical protein